MKNLTPIQIANKLKKLSGLDLFKDTRKQEYIAYRSLLTYLLRKKLEMRWTSIAIFYQSQGKEMHHATVMNLYKQYPVYRKNHKNLKEYASMFKFTSNLNLDKIDKLNYLENKCEKLEKKLSNPIYKLFKDIPEDKLPQVEHRIDLLKKSWAWK